MAEKVFLFVSSVASYTIPEFIVPISKIMRIKNSKIMNMDAYDFGLSGIFPHRASQFMTPFRHRICGEKNFTASRSSKFHSHRGCKCWYTVRVCMCALFLTLFVSETGLHSLYKKSWWPCAPAMDSGWGRILSMPEVNHDASSCVYENIRTISGGPDPSRPVAFICVSTTIETPPLLYCGVTQ